MSKHIVFTFAVLGTGYWTGRTSCSTRKMKNLTLFLWGLQGEIMRNGRFEAQQYSRKLRYWLTLSLHLFYNFGPNVLNRQSGKPGPPGSRAWSAGPDSQPPVVDARMTAEFRVESLTCPLGGHGPPRSPTLTSRGCCHQPWTIPFTHLIGHIW